VLAPYEETDHRRIQPGCPGTDVMFLKIFSPKKIAKKLAFLTQNKAKIGKILIITLVFEKNANFFAENCRKSRKIVIITSTLDEFAKKTIIQKCSRIRILSQISF
jgi:hypothetical protein